MIRTEGLTKVYESKSGRQEALQDVSIHVDKGDIFGIIGMSGAGKSTLLRLIGMLEQPTSGKVWIQGQDVSMLTQGQQKEQRKKLGIVFQGYNLLMQKTVRENVEFPLRLSKTPRTQRRERAQELLKVVGLGDREGAYPAQLSGGQKQRVALARTMVMKPKILLLDEPLSALDGVIKESIKDRIKTIAREYHLTTIIVTHDPEEALTLSDRVLIIEQGTISQYAKPEEIVHQPKNDFVRKFILNQLEIKRNNIYALFGDCPTWAVQAG